MGHSRLILFFLVFQVVSLDLASSEGIFSARTGPIVFPQNVQDPKYLINYIPYTPEGQEIKLEPGQESIVMTTRGDKYLCILPPPLPEDGASTGDSQNASRGGGTVEETTRKSPENLLDAMIDLPCFYRVEGWWTYELCYKKHLRQYHMEGEEVAVEFFLGHYDADATLDLHEQGGNSFLQKDPRSQTAAQRYHAHIYTNGTECDLTGEFRQTEVRYICSEDNNNFIASIKEAPTCRYTLLFHTSLLCLHPLFKKEALPVNLINCYALPEGSVPSGEAATLLHGGSDRKQATAEVGGALESPANAEGEVGSEGIAEDYSPESEDVREENEHGIQQTMDEEGQEDEDVSEDDKLVEGTARRSLEEDERGDNDGDYSDVDELRNKFNEL